MEKIIDVSALTDQLKILLWDRSKSREELAELIIQLVKESGEEVIRCGDCAFSNVCIHRYGYCALGKRVKS